MINKYKFGKMIIDNKEFDADLIITPNRIIDDWWRETGHLLQIIDLKNISFDNIKNVVIGTGLPGLMKVSDEIKVFFKEKEMTCTIKSTPVAVKHYNSLNPDSTVALFHLTC